MADYGSGTMGKIDHILGSRDEVFKPGPTADQDKIGNQEYYFQIDENTDKVEVKRKWTNVGGQIFDTTVGHYDKDGKYTCKGGSSGGYHQEECEYFTSKEGSNATLKQAKIVAQKDLQNNGSTRTRGQPVSSDEAQQETKKIIPTNTSTEEDDTESSAPINQSPTMIGTRTNFTQKTLIYPLGIEKNGQDTLKIDMMEYKPRDLQNKQGALGPGDRRIGTPIGSVILPIPGNIKDSDKVEWGEDSMNAGELALAAFGVGFIEKGTAGAETEAGKIMGGLKNLNKNNTNNAISNMLAGAAIGKDSGKLMSRATGQVMNPNMELLFNGPALRDFSFTFLLAPRSKDEAENVIRIIRFFKQGMAAIRSKSNLFLKAPHTFQLKYNYRGKDEHPYLNSFKECALKSCDVSYTPENSYSTYEDGVMTAYSLTLAFSELEPIYNDDYGQEDAAHLNFSATYDQGDGTIGKTETTPDGRTVQTTIDPIHGHEITTHGNQKTTIYDKKGNFTNEYLMSQTGGGSDIRLKENIIKVNQSPSGLNIYEWNYKSAPNSRYRGVMAQEVMKVVPEAVYAEKDGLLSVYYNLIDVNMELV